MTQTNTTLAARRAFCLALPSALMLAACSPGGSNDAQTSAPAEEFGIPASQPLSIDVVKKMATGFTVGQLLSAREVFVFFDPQCPHCASFWRGTEELRSKIKFTWIPVNFMGKLSTIEAAEILQAPDKVAIMNAHAAKVLVNGGRKRSDAGVSESSVEPQLRASITKNTRLFSSIGGEGVPYLVAMDGAGKPVGRGAMNPAELMQTFGWAGA